MTSSPQSIRQLTRAYAALRGLLLLLPLAVMPNLRAALVTSGYLGPNDGGGVPVLVGLADALALLVFYRRRFGVVIPEPPTPRWSQHLWYGLAGLAALVGSSLVLLTVWDIAGIGPKEFSLLATAVASLGMMAAARGARGRSIIMPIAAGVWLALTFAVPALHFYRASGHAVMVAALIWEAFQYHLFLVQGFARARV